jgi:tetratricopeptide (TPR) repeat protein
VEGRLADLRRGVAATTDVASRARLRVALADLLRAHGDLPAALAELRRAAAETPGATGVRLALASAAAALPATERAAFLIEVGQIATVEAPGWTAAAAEAHLEAGRPAQAARTWLALAADNSVPVHRRRSAARRAQEIAADGLPHEHLAALRLRASLATGRTRLGFLRQALAALDDDAVDHASRLAVAAAWVDAGAPGARVLPFIEAAEKALVAPDETARLRREIDRRRAPHARPAVPPARAADRRRPPAPGAAPPPVVAPRAAAAPAGPARRETPDGLIDRALAAARGGRGMLARRLAEQALRAAAPGAAPPARLGLVDAALLQGGHVRQALLLRRTRIEGEPAAARAVALEVLIAEAEGAGLPALAAMWRVDLARPVTTVREPARDEPAPSMPADFYLAAQRRLIGLPADADPQPVVDLLTRAVAGHAGADAALALGERLLRRSLRPASASLSPADAPIVDLLQAAFDAEDMPARRARLADRLAAALDADGDRSSALAILERAIAGLPLEGAALLRRRRARLLRETGKVRELAAALASDAEAFTGRDRLAALAERAQLLDGAGEPERALAERLTALSESPGELPGSFPILAPARRRLESTGRFEQSLHLAAAAVKQVTEPAERLRLLRDIAQLSEKATTDLGQVAAAWLAVLELDPDDVAAAEAAERFLMATGSWERCAELLSWAAARLETAGRDGAERRAELLWRLAELRRSRLNDPDEALRLYRVLGAPAQPPPSVAAAAAAGAAGAVPSPQRLLALQGARIAVAPTAADRAQAHLDRGLLVLQALGRTAEAEADLARALELDPRNVQVIAALERVCERTGKWAELGQRFKQKAAGLPPVPAARLWFGVGRVAERLDDPAAARDAYDRAMSLDPALIEPVIALRRIAAARGEWAEVARLMELEITLVGVDGDQASLLVDLAATVGDRLGQSRRAVELLDRAGAATSTDPRTLDLSFRFNLAAAMDPTPPSTPRPPHLLRAAGAPTPTPSLGPQDDRRWEAAAQALDRLLATGTEVPDAADRYFRVAAAAEAAIELDHALVLYSRSYSRNPQHRPTLERLSAICFEKGQWDNAWKATETLIDRYRATLASAELADLLVRSALCDVHIAQRLSALGRLAATASAGGGLRDVAESWAAMRLEPRLLGGLEGERRERVLDRLREALALTDAHPHPCRRAAAQILGALSIVERRWPEARDALDRLAADPDATPRERCGYLVAAGDIAGNMQLDAEAAGLFYARARAANPGDPRLMGRGAVGVEVSAIAYDNTGEIEL